MGGGGGSKKKTESTPVITEQEMELQRLSVDVAREQLAALQAQTAFQEEQFAALMPFLERDFENQQTFTEQQLDFNEQQLDIASRAAEQQFQLGVAGLQLGQEQSERQLALDQRQIELAEQAIAQSNELLPIQKELAQLELERIKQGTEATPEQLALIHEATNAALESGASDISEFSRQALEQVRNVVAPALGLRPTDSPILDRGANVAREATRQFGQLASNLRGIEANARLNFPLAASQLASTQTQGLQGAINQQLQGAAGLGLGQQQFGLSSDVGRGNLALGGAQLQQGASQFAVGGGQFQEQLALQAQQFQEQLRQKAITNRLGAASTFGGLGLGAANTSFIGSNVLSGNRMQTTTTTRGGSGGMLSGVGSLLAGAAAVYSAFSDRRLKYDEAELNKAELNVARRLRKLHRTFKYKEEAKVYGDNARTHVGMMAQDIVQAFNDEGLNAHEYAIVGTRYMSQGARYTVDYNELSSFIMAGLLEDFDNA